MDCPLQTRLVCDPFEHVGFLHFPRLFAQRNPMNRRDPVEGYEEHLEPVIRGAREARLNSASAGASRGQTGRTPLELGPRSKL